MSTPSIRRQKENIVSRTHFETNDKRLIAELAASFFSRRLQASSELESTAKSFDNLRPTRRLRPVNQRPKIVTIRHLPPARADRTTVERAWRAADFNQG
jgi:hypothetical protein